MIFYGNPNHAVYNTNAYLEIDAPHNYWGHPSGPTIDLENPLGDSVGEHVNYTPFESSAGQRYYDSGGDH